MSSTYVAGSAGGLLSMNFSFAVFSLMKLYLILTPEFSPVTDAFQLSAELRLHQIQMSRCSSRQPAFFFHGDVASHFFLGSVTHNTLYPLELLTFHLPSVTLLEIYSHVSIC